MTEADELIALQTISLGLAVLRPSDITRDMAPKIEDPDGPENTYGLPTGGAISEELKRWFAKQKQAVLDAIPKIATAPVPNTLPDVTDWDDPMARAFTPLLSVAWDQSGQDAMGRLGLDPAVFNVTNPHLKHQVEKAALSFCESTNATTSKQLAGQLAKLKRELVNGLVDEGESNALLSKRVQGVFETAETWRADRIAATESSRAYHAAQEAAAVESGVVAGFELLLSSDACPLCRMVATECQRQRIGKPFAVIGSNPDYATIRHPPLHPNCQCSMVEILTPEYGGPVDPKWDATLIQPKTEGWEPPAGKPVPEPEPGRKTPRPKTPKPVPPVPVEPPAVAKPKPEPAPKTSPVTLPTAHPKAPALTHEQIVALFGVTPQSGPRPGPKGKPVGEALDVKARGPVADAVDTAVAAIGRVHGDGTLKRIPVLESKSETENGAYAFRSTTGEPMDITISSRGKHPALTTAHEIGHFLEGSAIPGHAAGKRHFRTDPLFGEWVDAIVSSEAHKSLMAFREKRRGRKYLDYLLRGDELWARCYAQYIATRSGDPKMLAELTSLRDQDADNRMPPRQWADEDFQPIAQAIDRMFETLGWMNQ